MTPQLCLGTAQFGLDYGITNNIGKISIANAQQILDFAASSGIELFDTAQAYGNSETVLGKYMPATASPKFISKLLPSTAPESWDLRFRETLSSLNTDFLDTLLVHNSADFVGVYGDELVRWLISLKEKSIVKRLGVSIYDSSEISILPLDLLDVVQLPISLYDQRLLRDHTIMKLREHQISIHVRSIFLQGLLLAPPSQWPNFLSNDFISHHALCIKKLSQSGLTPLEATLAFFRDSDFFDGVLVGVASVSQLSQILDVWNDPYLKNSANISEMSWCAQLDLDPRLWPKK